MAKKMAPPADLSTEEKIREAARKLFTKKGYAATRTRDIAEEAGLNLALLNYYFRSKEKLFALIMVEKLEKFFGFLLPLIYDETSTLESKLETISAGYMDLLMTNPDLPFFILNEIKIRPDLIASVAKRKDFLKNSVFLKQLKERRPDADPLQFLLSLLGMCIFPFVMRPGFQKITETDDHKFFQMMKERKKLIPVWSKAILKAKYPQ
jgi:AcrR family transcriptional regulator